MRLLYTQTTAWMFRLLLVCFLLEGCYNSNFSLIPKPEKDEESSLFEKEKKLNLVCDQQTISKLLTNKKKTTSYKRS
jgi:hypothetical protein